MSQTWSLESLERDLNGLYEEIIGLENFKIYSEDPGTIAYIFLSTAEQYFRINWSRALTRTGYRLNYSYYFHNNKFAEINLLQCPKIEEREQYIKWFIDQIRLGRENIILPS